jgi:O-glycosyl hydrolase
MKQKTTPHRFLCNDDVLNVSVVLVEDVLKLVSTSNVNYTNKEIVYYLLNASFQDEC